MQLPPVIASAFGLKEQNSLIEMDPGFLPVGTVALRAVSQNWSMLQTPEQYCCVSGNTSVQLPMKLPFGTVSVKHLKKTFNSK